MAEPVGTGAYEPSYTFSVFDWWDDQGNYSRGPELRVCDWCGAVVGDNEAHDKWHEAHANAPSERA